MPGAGVSCGVLLPNFDPQQLGGPPKIVEAAQLAEQHHRLSEQDNAREATARLVDYYRSRHRDAEAEQVLRGANKP